MEHEIVSTVVTAMTPEEERLEPRARPVQVSSDVLGAPGGQERDDVLYDRLRHQARTEVRASASLQSHLVDFIYLQHSRRAIQLTVRPVSTSLLECQDRYRRIAFASCSTRIQKCSLFGFDRSCSAPARLALSKAGSAYSAKFLVQLFRCEDVALRTAEAELSNESDAVEFNDLINLCDYAKSSQRRQPTTGTLTGGRRPANMNSPCCATLGHLFPATRREDSDAAIRGFGMLWNQFRIGTCINNLASWSLRTVIKPRQGHFGGGSLNVAAIDSREAYQPASSI
ncbi:MAG: hypothetical protein IPJ50_13645 [Betaproteobacteria bacterium]|nr:hypothetical protein [Betaproteobacteria bacterium]